MRHPAPIVALLYRTRLERNALRGELAAALEQVDGLKADVAVARCREKKWRRLAFKWGGGHPQALTDMAWQAMSDDIADEAEIDDRQRNTFPRSLP